MSIAPKGAGRGLPPAGVTVDMSIRLARWSDTRARYGATLPAATNASCVMGIKRAKCSS